MAAPHEIYNEAEKLMEEGKLEEATAKFLEAAASDETYAMPHFALAVLYIKTGKPTEAVQHAETAVKLDPDDPRSYTALSVTYQKAYEGTGNPQFIQLAEHAMAKAREIQQGGP